MAGLTDIVIGSFFDKISPPSASLAAPLTLKK